MEDQKTQTAKHIFKKASKKLTNLLVNTEFTNIFSFVVSRG